MPRHGLLVTGLFSTRFLCGCYLSILATAMPTLANNVDREVSQTSWIISFRNFGIFFGGLLGSKVMKNRRDPVTALVAVIFLRKWSRITIIGQKTSRFYIAKRNDLTFYKIFDK